MEPVFLEAGEIVELHRILIERYGGLEGLRDPGMLESAIAMPQAGFGSDYFHKDLFEMAAAYLYHLVMNHPFADGNKRIGLAAAITFLKMNGVALVADNTEVEALVLRVASGEADKADIARFLRAYAPGPEPG